MDELELGFITRSTWAPGIASDQCAFQSKLASIYSIIWVVNCICKYYSILQGWVTLGCDGLGSLLCCFNVKSPSDLILAIQKELTKHPCHGIGAILRDTKMINCKNLNWIFGCTCMSQWILHASPQGTTLVTNTTDYALPANTNTKPQNTS